MRISIPATVTIECECPVSVIGDPYHDGCYKKFDVIFFFELPKSLLYSQVRDDKVRGLTATLDRSLYDTECFVTGKVSEHIIAVDFDLDDCKLTSKLSRDERFYIKDLDDIDDEVEYRFRDILSEVYDDIVVGITAETLMRIVTARLEEFVSAVVTPYMMDG